jgi:hypothetical protein
VITPCDGLFSPDAPLRARDPSGTDALVDVSEPRYRRPLVRTSRGARAFWAETEVVPAGSVASPKYVQLLTVPAIMSPSVGLRGRGDMSRGGA